MSDSDLKPCPFCGGHAIERLSDDGKVWFIECERCTCMLWTYYRPEGREHWNKRVGEPEIEGKKEP